MGLTTRYTLRCNAASVMKIRFFFPCRVTDKTYDNRTVGIDVVEASILKVSWVLLYERSYDMTTLLRIALAETNLGKDSAKMEANKSGIWQVSYTLTVLF